MFDGFCWKSFCVTCVLVNFLSWKKMFADLPLRMEVNGRKRILS